MKVLQVMCGAERGGAEEFFVRLAAAFVKTPICQKVVIRAYPDRVDELKAKGVEMELVPFGRRLDFRTPFTLRKIIREWEPDVVLSWMGRAAEVCSRSLTKGGPVHVGRLGGFYKLKYFKKCDHLIGNTMGMVGYIGKWGWPASATHYLPNFVSPKKSKGVDRATLATPQDVPLLLGLGRLHPNKAFDVLLESLEMLPGHWLWIAGTGPEERSLRARAQELGIEKRVRFLGWRRDVGSLLASADVLVCPSREEPLGNVIIESWAHEVPVVAAASAGPRELISHEKDGLLCKVDDPAALADAIIMAEGGMAVRLSVQGLQNYQENFSEEIVVKKYLQFFESVTR